MDTLTPKENDEDIENQAALIIQHQWRVNQRSKDIVRGLQYDADIRSGVNDLALMGGPGFSATDGSGIQGAKRTLRPASIPMHQATKRRNRRCWWSTGRCSLSVTR